jgi:hypothetical protein
MKVNCRCPITIFYHWIQTTTKDDVRRDGESVDRHLGDRRYLSLG